MAASARRAPSARVVVASIGFSAAFIARSSFTIRGRRAFSLFDDAMISMTYARNLARGHGLVWNAGGPRVEGITNPLWALVMAAVQVTRIDDRYASLPIMIVGAGLLVACVLLARRIALTLMPERPIVGTIAAWLVALDYALIYWTLRGVEVGLMSALALAGTLCCLRIARGRLRDAWLLGAIGAAGVSTRLDFAVFVVAFVAYLVVRTDGAARRRALVITAGIPFVALVLQEITRRAYYGSWVPNTYRLKIDGYSLGERVARGIAVLVFGMVEEWGAVLVFAVLALGAFGVADRVRRNDAALPLMMFGASLAYSTWVGGDAWEWMRYSNRYLTPGVAVLLCGAAVGVVRLADEARLPTPSRALRLAVAAVAVLFLLAILRPFDGGRIQLELGASEVLPATRAAVFLLVALVVVAVARSRLSPGVAATVVACGMIAALSLPAGVAWFRGGGALVDADGLSAEYGVTLNGLTSPGATVAVVLAGAPIFFAHRAGIDLLGKSDERIASTPPHAGYPFFPGHSKWDYRISISEEQPDLVARLWQPTSQDLDLLRRDGYVRVVPVDPGTFRQSFPFGRREMFARLGSPRVRWDRLRRVDISAG